MTGQQALWESDPAGGSLRGPRGFFLFKDGPQSSSIARSWWKQINRGERFCIGLEDFYRRPWQSGPITDCLHQPTRTHSPPQGNRYTSLFGMASLHSRRCLTCSAAIFHLHLGAGVVGGTEWGRVAAGSESAHRKHRAEVRRVGAVRRIDAIQRYQRPFRGKRRSRTERILTIRTAIIRTTNKNINNKNNSNNKDKNNKNNEKNNNTNTINSNNNDKTDDKKKKKNNNTVLRW